MGSNPTSSALSTSGFGERDDLWSALDPRLVDRAKWEHPYEVPGVVAVSIVDGGSDFLRWMVEETEPRTGKAGRRLMDERIQTMRLVLVPVSAGDAEELVAVFADERLYAFTGGKPGAVEDLRRILGRLAQDRAADPTAQLNWVVRRLSDGEAVGMLQAVFSSGGRAAEIAWLVGVPWQGQGLASEAAMAVVTWLEARGMEQITAWIRPDHHASESVASRAGLTVTEETRTTGKHEHVERLWRRQQSKKPAE